MKQLLRRVVFILALVSVLPVLRADMPPELAELDEAMSARGGHDELIAEPIPAVEQEKEPQVVRQAADEVMHEETVETPQEKEQETLVIEAKHVNGETQEFFALPVVPAASDTDEQAEDTEANLITIALDDVELIDVVRMFSRIANANIIATPSNLTARVTANLDRVEWRPALASILSMHGLALLERPQGSGVYSITSQPADAPEPMIVETIFLDYTTVDEVLPVVETMLVPNGTVSTFPSRNAMVVRSTESNLNEMRIVIKDIDIQSKQVCIETQFMELNDSAIKQLGIRWDSLEQLGVGFQAGPFVMQDERQRTSGREDAINRADRRFSTDVLDQRYNMFGSQYEGEQRVIIDERPVGPPFETINITESATISPTRRINRSVNLQQDVTSDITDSFTRTLTESSAAILNIDSLNIVLSALKKTDGVSIVSNPKVIVANGTTNAFFRVGQREPIIKRTIKRGTTDSPGDEITANLDIETNTDYIKAGYLHTGIELKVVPTVKVDDLIEVQIEPSLRRKVGEKTVDGNSWPLISVKEIKTKFTLHSGQTVAIGGLTDTTDSKRTSKIPLLGDIPILGKYLFSHTRDEQTQVETIIFVSLSLVEPRNLADDEGIPERSRLVHKARIQDQIKRKEFEDELQQMRDAAEELEKHRRERKSNRSAE